MQLERVIGRYTGNEKGPLLICFGGMHGNEPAGVRALEIMFKMLEVEPLSNPRFSFKGRLLGLRGNLRALQAKKRYIVKDLNRQWTPENVERALHTPPDQLDSEELELRENILLIRTEIEDYQPEKIVVLDIHTTTAFGGIFTIATNDPESLRIAKELHAPVVMGMLKGIQGTTLHYFTDKNIGRRCMPVAFEAGQHDETLSVNRAIAALTNCMRTIGCVSAKDVENRHDKLLIEFSKGLPKVAELMYVHHIQSGEHFKMLPGFKNFQPVKKGQPIATNQNGLIYAPTDGLILMPLYQAQGEDGFFIIKQAAY